LEVIFVHFRLLTQLIMHLLTLSNISLLPPFNIIFFTLLLFCAFVALGQWRQSKDAAIPWYIGYLLGTLGHYGRQFWISGVGEFNFINPPDPPLHWGTPLSYAAFACYFLFIDGMMNTRISAPRLSRALTGIARFFVFMIGLHLLIQVIWGHGFADKVHQVFQAVLLPTMVLVIISLLRNAHLFYQKLVLIGTIALVIGFVCVLATRMLDGRHDPVAGVICCFPMPWGKDVCLYHLKVGIVLDVLCFSWALTLRQRVLLLAEAPVKIIEVNGPAAPAEVIFIEKHEIETKDSLSQQIRDFLEQHFQQDTLKVGDIAKALHTSADKVARKLKEETGLTTEQYILQYRLERAADMLLHTDKTVSEIYRDIGLKNLAHFSNAFKDRYKLSPLAFRKNGLKKTNKDK
jgi:AraC-like DNA-binding protein